ncbi:MotA/TolQ/ExbB proton channel family protein [Caldimonas tepidiphila]|uniref:MotA/TolQ/ExbB proton channel family protein n=1 Tax=Caldimonas tepidiphila TaxID=2315841 RepID=UPI000E5C47B9|nr:MotA/TolQ/ExbB proton channel family protein [Caldimonas tepidiphila]
MLSIIQAAGWPIWPLILCSVAALALVIERFASLRAVRVAPPNLVEEVVTVTRTGLPSPDVVNKLAQNSLMGDVLASGMRALLAEPGLSEDKLRGAFESAGRSAVHRMERYLNALGTIAAVAPLLGLLGTVVGMIEIFNAHGGGVGTPGVAGDPQQLAHGISVALYNTAFGLIVAIPALTFHRYFRRRIESFTLDLEQAAERMASHLLRYTHVR